MNEVVEAAALTMPRIGDPAPDFVARSTEGELRLSHYRGRWLVLFSHPGDFTPVCTSEFIALARAADRFGALGCDLVGHSIDSLFSHLAWIRAIRDEAGVVIPFPIIEDPNLAIARAYGMLPARAGHTATVRAVHIIDPQGTVRAIIWYPMEVGRSVEELLRLVAALQSADQGHGLAPEGWQAGGPLLAPSALLREQVLAIDARGNGDHSWFCRTAPPGGT